jgi:aspartokinase-like uncharacterized kinase
MSALVVAKVGGSLYDLPDLGPRLWRWLTQLDAAHVLLAPGGGPTADAIRQLDRWQRLGDEAAHWLALQALAVNARFLAALLPNCPVIDDPGQWPRTGRAAVLDAYRFALADERRAGRLPHTWDVTSDAIAARAAVVAGAGRLVLLKSVTVPSGADWAEAARQGWVDPALVALAGSLEVRVVNFREWS